MTVTETNIEAALTSEEAAGELVAMIKRAGIMPKGLPMSPLDAITPALAMKKKYTADMQAPKPVMNTTARV